MPWKNGGGTTTEVLVYPAGAGVDDFDWRISMAAVERDGPFSGFPGIERSLAVLKGAGIELIFSSQRIERLTNGSVLKFAADLPVEARLIDGPMTDLNIMTRCAKFRHTVRKLSGAANMQSRGTLVLFSPGSGLRIDDGTEQLSMAAGDTVIHENGAMLQVVPENSAAYYLIEIAQKTS